jgi:tRNA-2-methylthio-N6-dimethylallyladenosine synthase
MTPERKLYIETYGCQMNVHESDMMVGMLQELNYRQTTDPTEADLVLLNTCSVRAKAEEKVYSSLGKWRLIKKKRPWMILGVAGCVAQQEKDRLLSRVPELDLVFGPQNLHRLPSMLREFEAQHRQRLEINFYRSYDTIEVPRAPTMPVGVSAFVSVMQGCNNVCTFCVVPYTRGPEVSRKSNSILAEVKDLTDRGVREVILLGQNVNSYGSRIKGELTFSGLLAKLNSLPELERIRFTTSHPKDLTEELVGAFRDLEKVCEHFHLPVQSGSNGVLSKMRRGYTVEAYLARVEALRKACPNIALTTDVIVGFPGETERDFSETLALIQAVKYDDIYAFKYSPRPDTVASRRFGDDVSSEIKSERLSRLQNAQCEISLLINQGYVGANVDVLIEGKGKRGEGRITGRTRTNKVVILEGPESWMGKVISVRVEGFSTHSLFGEAR